MRRRRPPDHEKRVADTGQYPHIALHCLYPPCRNLLQCLFAARPACTFCFVFCFTLHLMSVLCCMRASLVSLRRRSGRSWGYILLELDIIEKNRHGPVQRDELCPKKYLRHRSPSCSHLPSSIFPRILLHDTCFAMSNTETMPTIAAALLPKIRQFIPPLLESFHKGTSSQLQLWVPKVGTANPFQASKAAWPSSAAAKTTPARLSSQPTLRRCWGQTSHTSSASRAQRRSSRRTRPT